MLSMNRLSGAWLTRIVVVGLVCLFVDACAETPTQPRDTTLPTGRWTGEGACLSVAVDGCDLVVGAATVNFHHRLFTPTAPSKSTAPIASRWDPSALNRRRPRCF